MPVRIAKRSQEACAISNVPELSCGFIVPMQKNGRGRACRRLPTVTACSSIASSRPDCMRGRRAVELVQHDGVREERPGDELVGAQAGVGRLDLLADHAGRRQVLRALDARVMAADRPGDDLGERRLADSGNVLDEQVPGGEQAAQGERRRTVDLDHRIADLFPERMRDVARVDQHSLFQQRSRPLALASSGRTIGVEERGTGVPRAGDGRCRRLRYAGARRCRRRRARSPDCRRLPRRGRRGRGRRRRSRRRTSRTARARSRLRRRATSSITACTSSREPTLWASAIPPQRAPSSASPRSAASLSRAQSTSTTPFAWKNAVSSMSIAGVQPERLVEGLARA